MGVLQSRLWNASSPSSPEAVSYHRRDGACAPGCHENGSAVIVDSAALPSNAPANDVVIAAAAAPAQVR